MSATFQHVVTIVGGGAAGMTVASLLRMARPDLDIAIIEPSADHFYQPAWTLVGGGAYDVAKTKRPMKEFMPKGVHWIQQRVSAIDPDQRLVTLDDGRTVNYGWLVVAAGIQINWQQIEGLEASLGANGVTSNYRFDLAPYTWQCAQKLQGGQRAVFTQPQMPIKCAGAPQKAMYLTADHLRKKGLHADIRFAPPGPSMFGIPFYAHALDKVVADYGITPMFGHELIKVDGAAQTATFRTTDDNGTREVEHRFDMLHVVPPQSAPDFLREGPLVDSAGWVEVDRETLRHTRYDTIFALGDCSNTPNSKTAAAARGQAPIAAHNVLAAVEDRADMKRYDGYASCPLTTSHERVMLAEFGYDGKIMPSFPADPRKPRRFYWWIKQRFLPWLYWRMLKGKLGPDWHRTRTFPEAPPQDIRP